MGPTFRSGHSLSTPCRDGTGQLSSIGRGTDKTGQNPNWKRLSGHSSQSGPFTADDIVIRFHDSGQEPSFNDYIRQQIVRLKRLGKIRTSETYTPQLKSFSSFMKGSDILFGELSSDLLMEYEAYLKNRGTHPIQSRSTCAF